MLPGMLLHVVVTAFPVDDPSHLGCCERRIHNVTDAVFFIDHFSHRHAAQCAQIERLAAGSGIESREVEINPVAFDRNDARAELAQIAILIIKTVSQLLGQAI
jgi:hypothetical protein